MTLEKYYEVRKVNLKDSDKISIGVKDKIKTALNKKYIELN